MKRERNTHLYQITNFNTMIKLKQLDPCDGMDIFSMLKKIEAVENSFTNPVKNMNYQEYKNWLLQQDQWRRGINLPKGYVKQTIYWLYIDEIPVGIGKIRQDLTDNSRNNGGNIGYAISSDFRGHGYGTKLLALLLREADAMGVNEVVLTVDKYNTASKCVIESNGGKLYFENSKRWFYRFW